MTKIKFCGLTNENDIKAANELMPDYIGFVFAPKSKRYISPEKAKILRAKLNTGIEAVGVFVNETPEAVARMLNENIIDIAQLHGSEDEEYITELRRLSKKPIIKAFKIKTAEDLKPVKECSADHVLLDSGAGTGSVFDWELIKSIDIPYFLAGGLDADNIEKALSTLEPYAVDVSSGIETNGSKDKSKMAAFAHAVRKDENL